MPIVEPDSTDVFSLDPNAVVGSAPPPGVEHSVMQAAFRQSNVIGASWSSQTGVFQDPSLNVMDPNYDPWNDIKGTPYAERWKDFADSNNARMTAALKREVDQEDQDRRTIAAGGWGGTFAGMFAGAVDPTLFVPIGGEVRGAVKGGFALGRAALKTGAATGTAVAAQEGLLHQEQADRSTEESLLNVGGGVVLGALLGSASHALLSPKEVKTAEAGFNVLNDPVQNRAPTGLSSADATQYSTDDLTVAGTAAEVAASAWKYNPNARLNASPSATARQTAQQLTENSMYQNLHAEGESLGPAVETAAQQKFRARTASAVQQVNDIYAEMKQSGIKMSREDFEAGISVAGRRNDVHPGGNDFISRGAKAIRKTIIDPYFEEAKAQGLFTENDRADFAESYWPRSYNTRLIENDEPRFKQVVADHVEKRLEGQHKAELAVLIDKKAAQEAEGVRLQDQQGMDYHAVNAKDIEATLDPVPEGHTRLYRAEKVAGKGLDYTDNLAGEALPTQEGAGGRLYYVDVADENLAAMKNAEGGYRLSEEQAAGRTSVKGLERMVGSLDSRIKRVQADIAKMEAEHNSRWAARQDVGEGGGTGFKELAADVASEVFNKITGRNYGNETSLDPHYSTPIERGPFKERTLPVPDKVLEEHGYLENNAMRIANIYARTVGADTELTRAFGDPTMKGQILAVRDEYEGLRQKMREAALEKIRSERPPVAGDNGAPLTVEDLTPAERATMDARTAKEVKRLSNLERRDINDLTSLRDLQRGTYKMRENASMYGRVVRGLNHFNFIRLLGGVVRASLSDMYRSSMVHGLGRFMTEGLPVLLRTAEAAKLGRAEAQACGVAVNRLLHHRVMSMAELADPYARGNAFERFLENTTKAGAKWSGIDLWNDVMEGVNSQMSMNRILSGKIDPRTAAFLGIDGNMAERIGKEFAAHGEVKDTIHLAHTEDWQDEDAVRAFRSAIVKDVNRTIVRPGYGDEPLFMHTPTGRLLLQFKSFTMAAHQKVLVAGLQEGKARFVSGLVGMTALGVLSTILREWGGGKDRWEKFKESATNPGYLLGEGLDNSGLFTMPLEVGNDVEKMTRAAGFTFNPVKTPLLAAGTLVNPGASMQGQSTRFHSGGLAPGIAGPSAGLVFDTAPNALGAGVNILAGEPVTKKQARAAASLVPFNTYPGMHAALQVLNDDSPYLK